MAKKIIGSIIVLLLGGVFIFSGVAKYLVLEEYEIMLVKQHIGNWETTRFIARLIIAFELSLGILLIAHYRSQQLLIMTMAVIALLSGFLGWQIISGTELENCYCFGETLQLNNTESLVKNAVMMVMALIAWKTNVAVDWSKWKLGIVSSAVMIVAATTISILNPPINIYEQFSIDDFKTGDPFPVLDSLDASVYQGKVILGFFSPTCPHCRQAAMKMQILHEQKPQTYRSIAVFGFGKKKIPGFLKASGLTCEQVMLEKKDFLKLTKGVFPQMYVLEDGKILEILNKEKFISKNL